MKYRRSFTNFDNLLTRIGGAALTLGFGPTGAKTEQYRFFCKHIERLDEAHPGKATLEVLPNVATTPSFWSHFLGRAGVSRSKPDRSERAILRTPFKPEEREYLQYINYLMSGDPRSYRPYPAIFNAWRSDEATAGGCGIWKGGIVLNDGSPKSLADTEAAVKKILASHYSRDVAAFIERVGLPDINPGTLAMPLVFDVLTVEGTQVATTLYHINAILNFYGPGDHLAVFGMGIGGANCVRPAVYRFKDGEDFERLTHKHLGNLDIDPRMLLSRDGSFQKGVAHHRLESEISRYLDRYREIIGSDVLSRLSLVAEGLTGQTYIEAAFDFYYRDPLRVSLLQASPIVSTPFSKPDVPSEQKILDLDSTNSVQIVGRGVVHSKSVFQYSPAAATKTMGVAITNKKFVFPEGSVIITDVMPQNFFIDFDFFQYAKVSAIIFSNPSGSPVKILLSHFNGALREAGILVMRGYVNPAFMISLPINKLVEKNMVVYANDAIGEAFAATA